MNVRSTLIGSFRAELIQLVRSPFLILLTVIQAITFIFLVNFFGMTGAFAPTALIDNDRGYYAKAFIENLKSAHHSFDLRAMDEKSALKAVKQGKIVAMITIPEGFSNAIDDGETIPIKVVVDNIDTDMTADIQRALPSAIAGFGNQFELSGIHVRTEEFDLIDHDTGFIPYLVVSALALSAFIISGIFGAVTVAREFESKTVNLLLMSPIHPIIPLIGRVRCRPGSPYRNGVGTSLVYYHFRVAWCSNWRSIKTNPSRCFISVWYFFTLISYLRNI
jgi:ABC-2 type transport system permease protein